MTYQQRCDAAQKVYENCRNSENVLFNALSSIVVICADRFEDVFDKVDEVKEVAFEALEKSKKIGLTNPDLYGSEDRKNSLSRQIKLARLLAQKEKT